MRKPNVSRLWSMLTVVSVGTALLSMIGTPEAHGGPRACCLANDDCVQATSTTDCRDTYGGQATLDTDTLCKDVDCPIILCGDSGPQCNGDCPSGQACIDGPKPGRGGEGGGSFVDGCECVPEIPQGGACDDQPDACAGGLPCEDGVCCNAECGGSQERCDLAGNKGICTSTAAQAPAMSNTGLAMIVALLIGLGAFTLARRRQTG